MNELHPIRHGKYEVSSRVERAQRKTRRLAKRLTSHWREEIVYVDHGKNGLNPLFNLRTERTMRTHLRNLATFGRVIPAQEERDRQEVINTLIGRLQNPAFPGNYSYREHPDYRNDIAEARNRELGTHTQGQFSQFIMESLLIRQSAIDVVRSALNRQTPPPIVRQKI